MAEHFKGRFFDGQSAVRHDVVVDVDSTGVRLEGGPFGCGDLWDFAALKLLNREPNDTGLVLTRIDDPGIRLTIAGPGAWDAVMRCAPEIAAVAEPTGIGRPLFITFSIIVVLAAAYLTFPYFSGGIAKAVPQSWAAQIGGGMIAGITQEEKICSDPDGDAVLTAMVDRLTGSSDVPFDIEVYVVDHPLQNAFVAPGGRIVLFRGLLKKADSAEAVAGVIAHEIGHAINRHPLDRLVQVFGLQLFFGSASSNFGGLAGIITILSYGRGAEAEADRDGVMLLNQAGISADAIARFFDRLGGDKKCESGIPSFLSSHPRSAERARIIREADRVKSVEPLMSEDDWDKLRGICVKPKELEKKTNEEQEKTWPLKQII